MSVSEIGVDSGDEKLTDDAGDVEPLLNDGGAAAVAVTLTPAAT
jgi:hypothetical protein